MEQKTETSTYHFVHHTFNLSTHVFAAQRDLVVNRHQRFVHCFGTQRLDCHQVTRDYLPPSFTPTVNVCNALVELLLLAVSVFGLKV